MSVLVLAQTSGVLDPGCTLLSVQLRIQECHDGGLESAMAGAFTPWKLAPQGFVFLAVINQSTEHDPEPLLSFFFFFNPFLFSLLPFLDRSTNSEPSIVLHVGARQKQIAQLP